MEDYANELIVRRCEKGYEVIVEGRTTGLLTVGEMIEQVVSILPSIGKRPQYPMHTPEEWAAKYPKSHALKTTTTEQ